MIQSWDPGIDAEIHVRTLWRKWDHTPPGLKFGGLPMPRTSTNPPVAIHDDPPAPVVVVDVGPAAAAAAEAAAAALVVASAAAAASAAARC